MANEATAKFHARAKAERARFVEALNESVAAQDMMFRECVLKNAETAFGRDHGVRANWTMKDYQKAVPIKSYEDLAPYIERAAAGESKVLTAEDPAVFLRTSGHSGAAKKVPRNSAAAKFHASFHLTIWGNLLEHYPELAELDDSTLYLVRDIKPGTSTTDGGKPFVSGGSLPPAPEVADLLDGMPGTLSRWFIPPAEVNEYSERMYYRIRQAADGDLRGIVVLNPSTLIAVAQLLETHAERLIAEMRAGTVLGVQVRPPNAARARELQALLQQHGKLEPKHVWPRLRVIQCWKSASPALYLPAVREKYGEHVELLPYPIVATEASIAAPVNRHPTACALAINYTLFEFVPAEQDVAPTTQTMSFRELEVGKEYAIVLTLPRGLYRYDIGDVLRVVDRFRDVPLVEFVRRRGDVASFTGEKLTEPHVRTAVQDAAQRAGLTLKDFICCPRWGTPPGYIFAVDANRGGTDADAARLAEHIDTCLGEQNDEYPGKRSSGRLAPARVVFVKPGAFMRYREKRIAQGASSTQLKERRLQKDDAILKELEEASPPP
ncbi:MAG: GH3 auxin-responsive promoter family protein [Myxococcaceae bacterium]